MKPVPKGVKFFLLFVIIVLIPSTLFFFIGMEHRFTTLPYFGPKEVNAPGDTTYFTVPPFAFTDQNGHTLRSADLEGKVLVVDFFFTRCTTICPKMSRQMRQLNWALDDEAFSNVVFLSHTVDPEHDTPEVLREYARQYQADTTRWKFLTGPKLDIYTQGVKGYFLSTQEDALAPDGFLHSEMFVLIDSQRHIRGYYDGTDLDEVNRLAEEIKMLMKEDKDRNSRK